MTPPVSAERAVLRPQRIGLLVNTRSGRFARRGSALAAELARMPIRLRRDADEPDSIGAAVRELCAAGADLIAVLGGDGTLQAALTALPPVSPALLVVPCGTTNMTAIDVGTGQRPERVLERLHARIAAGAGIALTLRHVLRVQQPGTAPQCGMFLGAGLIASGVRYFSRHVRGAGLTGEGASALVLGRFLLRLLGGARDADMQPARARLSEDGADGVAGEFMLLFASTLDRLLLGMRPYWGREAAPLHLTAVRDRPRGLWRSLPRLVRGRGALLSPADYHSRNLFRLGIELDGEYALDGELHMARGRIDVDSVGPVGFAVP